MYIIQVNKQFSVHQLLFLTPSNLLAYLSARLCVGIFSLLCAITQSFIIADGEPPYNLPNIEIYAPGTTQLSSQTQQPPTRQPTAGPTWQHPCSDNNIHGQDEQPPDHQPLAANVVIINLRAHLAVILDRVMELLSELVYKCAECDYRSE